MTKKELKSWGEYTKEIDRGNTKIWKEFSKRQKKRWKEYDLQKAKDKAEYEAKKKKREEKREEFEKEFDDYLSLPLFKRLLSDRPTSNYNSLLDYDSFRVPLLSLPYFATSYPITKTATYEDFLTWQLKNIT